MSQKLSLISNVANVKKKIPTCCQNPCGYNIVDHHPSYSLGKERNREDTGEVTKPEEILKVYFRGRKDQRASVGPTFSVTCRQTEAVEGTCLPRPPR